MRSTARPRRLVPFLVLALGISPAWAHNGATPPGPAFDVQEIAAAAGAITIAPAAPVNIENCFPLGWGDPRGWPPFMGFVYQNIPAFSIVPGDTIAFDMVVPNALAQEFDIAMVATTVNGGDVPVGEFTTVVTNSQTPAGAPGDSTLGNFDLVYTVESPYSFPGGGLIILFSNPSAAYLTDDVCEGTPMGTRDPGDASGFFVERFYGETDAEYPWEFVEQDYMAAVQITATAPVPTMPTYALTIAGLAVLGLGAWVLSLGRKAVSAH